MEAGKVDITIDDMEGETSAEKQSPEKGPPKKMLILIGALILLLGVGGYFGYSLFVVGKDKTAKAAQKDNKSKEKTVLVSLEPFILNLSDPGRHLKVALQFELIDGKDEVKVKETTPKLRDMIIMLLSSKSVDSVSSAEGKFQLKDEILLRANQVMDKELFKSVYFTDFVMQ
jgi:flagellar FliL protein